MSYERRVILRHSLASVVALGMMGIVRFFYSAVVARRFGVETLGAVNSLISQAFFLAIPLSFFAVALGKYSSEFLGKNRLESIRAITLPSFLLPLTGLLLLPVNAYLSILAVFRAIQLTLRSFLYGIHRGEHYAYAILLAFPAFLLGFLSHNALAPYVFFLGVISLFAWFYLLRFDLIGPPRNQELRALVSYSGFAFLGTLSGVFLVQGPYFMSEKLSGPEVAGVVSAVLSSVFLLTYLPQVLQSAIMPLISYKHGRGEREYIRELTEKSVEILTVITALAVFGLMLIGNPLLSRIFGFDLGVSFYVALMAVEVYISYNPTVVALNSTSYIKQGTVSSILGALVALGSWVLLVPRFGATGVMIGLFIGYTSILVGVALYSRALLGIRTSTFLDLVTALALQLPVFVSPYLLIITIPVYLFLSKERIKLVVNSLRLFHDREP
jgi:O-antigen/teichoic acid export membrane protein